MTIAVITILILLCLYLKNVETRIGSIQDKLEEIDEQPDASTLEVEDSLKRESTAQNVK